MEYIPKDIPDEVNLPPDSALKDFLILIVGLLAMLVGIYVALGWAVDWVAIKIPVDAEKKLGVWLGAELFKDEKARTHPSLQALVDRLAVAGGYTSGTFTVSVDCTPQINAFAVPGGTIVVWDGLLKAVASENELAMVLGHEIGHFYHRDHLRRLGRGLVVAGVMMALGLDVDGHVANTLLGGASGVLSKHFSQSQETEADVYGAAVVYKVYGSHAAMTDFFERLSHTEISPTLERWVSSHPPSSQRVAHLKRHIETQGWTTQSATPLEESLRTLCSAQNGEKGSP